METPTQNPEIKLDKKSKILFIVVGLLIIGSVAATFWRYMVKRDYIVQAQSDCDPETENCFIWECDPQSSEEGEACAGDPETDIWYYKIIRRNAKNIPLCDPNDENCAALVCGENEPECFEELCTAENVPEGETCNDPEQYLLENPTEDEEECAADDEECPAGQEAAECEEGDEECLAKETACEGEDETCAAEEESAEEVPAGENCEEGDTDCPAAADDSSAAEEATKQPIPAVPTPQLEPM